MMRRALYVKCDVLLKSFLEAFRRKNIREYVYSSLDELAFLVLEWAVLETRSPVNKVCSVTTSKNDAKRYAYK